MKLIIFSLLLLLSSSSFAQRGYVRKAVEKNQEEKHKDERKKGEDAVNERLDALDAQNQKSRAAVQPFPNMSFTMDMVFPKKAKNNMTMHYYFKNYNCATIMESETKKESMDKIIMNFKEGKSTILMTDRRGKKTGMKMDLKGINGIAKSVIKKNEHDLETNRSSIKETDEYKTIEGYNCRKYISEDDRNITEFWVSTDKRLDYSRMNDAFSSVYMNSKSASQNPYFKAGMKGFTIQTHVMPKDNGSDECIITTKAIQFNIVNDQQFSTDGYEITEMPSMKSMFEDYNKNK